MDNRKNVVGFPAVVTRFSLLQTTKIGLGHAQRPPLIKWISGALSPGLKRTGREAGDSLYVEVKNEWR